MAQFRGAAEAAGVANNNYTSDPSPRPPRDKVYDTWPVRIIMAVAGVICLIIWTIFGFLVWLPLMSRMITTFSTAVMSAMITGRDPSDAKHLLDYASTFYVRGFMVIMDAMRGTLHLSGPYIRPAPKHAGRMLMELVFCLMFWIGIVGSWVIWTQRVPFGWMSSSIASVYASTVPFSFMSKSLVQAAQKPRDEIRSDRSSTGLKDRDGRDILVDDVVLWQDASKGQQYYVVRKSGSHYAIARSPTESFEIEISAGTGLAGTGTMKVVGYTARRMPSGTYHIVQYLK